eukprot:6315260-Ditylum_brightwellii.AAC.1
MALLLIGIFPSKMNSQVPSKPLLQIAVLPLIDIMTSRSPIVIYHKQKGSISMEHSNSEYVLADPNTKPHGDKTLRMKLGRLIGTRFYLPKGSVHYDLLFNAPEVSIERLQQTSK